VQVNNRMLKYAHQAARVSQWIESKLKGAITKNMVLPSCGDGVLPGLMALDHPHATNPLVDTNIPPGA
jgi:hypothetical protein